MADKKADLAGPGIGDYEELEKILPTDYAPLLDPRETQEAITAVKDYIEENLCKELNLIRVECPLIVDAASGWIRKRVLAGPQGSAARPRPEDERALAA